MAFAWNKTLLKRLIILPFLLGLFAFFFYRQITNLYWNVEFAGNVSTAKAAFDLFKRKPLVPNVCGRLDLLNVGIPDEEEAIEYTPYPQVLCIDPKFQITKGDCLILVFSTEKDRSFEDVMDQSGCEVHSFHNDPNVTITSKNETTSRIQFHPLDDAQLNQTVREILGRKRLVDYLLVRIINGPLYEYQVLDQFLGKVIHRVKQMSIGINLCPSSPSDPPDDQRFNEDHFQGVRHVWDKMAQRGWTLIDVANDEETFTYNPILEENTFCSSQFALLNLRYHPINHSS